MSIPPFLILCCERVFGLHLRGHIRLCPIGNPLFLFLTTAVYCAFVTNQGMKYEQF
ncbi:hypothetical protein HMPREF0262_02642 [Clostridium sp. ATCC 29733]|nr:hypothetical protein HMPREF0262_02642 [Clostridium sp. ATCC 29733]